MSTLNTSGESANSRIDRSPKIRPVVMYPFVQPVDLEALDVLIDRLREVAKDEDFLKPKLVINNQTMYRSSTDYEGIYPDDEQERDAFRKAVQKFKQVSDITYVWAVDTCAMWIRGLGDAFEEARKAGRVNDVFWLIPGDFNYATDLGTAASIKMLDIPHQVLNGKCKISLGEIEASASSSKQLIDTYGTYGLLYNWFPRETQGIMKVTHKPRTEFFALSYDALENALIHQRWFAYEQTLMLLLQNMKESEQVRRMLPVPLGPISDEESTRSTLTAAMAQVERTERALKLLWRQRFAKDDSTEWQAEFWRLDRQSESIRTAAMVIMGKFLRPKS